MQKPKQADDKTMLLRAGILLVITLTVLGLWRLGVLTTIAQYFVKNQITTMQNETERQQNQPRTIVLKTGKRIMVKRVLDQGQYWGFVTLDGNTGGVYKKDDVAEIIDESKGEPQK